MQISTLGAAQSGAPAILPDSVAAAALVLGDRSGAVSLSQQLKSYQDLAGRWRGARGGERQALARTLTESPFAQRVQSTLNTFTRAAWAGPDAVPPEPQAKMLAAFDALSPDDQQIVAGVQVDAAGAPAYASADDYRARLQDDLDRAQPRRADSVTLSTEAKAALAGAPPPAPPQTPEVAPERAAAIAAYAKLAR
ncbi:MAG: hypothetical protein V4597_01345 [Pseudomonadota bacterium]